MFRTLVSELPKPPVGLHATLPTDIKLDEKQSLSSILFASNLEAYSTSSNENIIDTLPEFPYNNASTS